MAERRQFKLRRKWIQRLNDDLLICKRRAVAMTTSEQPPLERNGKKKGYIKIMKEVLGELKVMESLDSRIKTCVIKPQGLKNQ